MAMNPEVPSEPITSAIARQRQAARDAGDRGAERAGHAGAVQDAQQEDRRAVGRWSIEHVAQQADDEARPSRHSQILRGPKWSMPIALEEPHRQAADHADADDQADVSTRCRPGTSTKSAYRYISEYGYHQRRVRDVGAPEGAAVNVRGDSGRGASARASAADARAATSEETLIAKAGEIAERVAGGLMQT